MANWSFWESEVTRRKDEISTQATSLPELIQEESNHVTTVVIFVISAILTITLLFVIAVFIDCRQEKLQRLSNKEKSRKILRLKLPIKIKRTSKDDRDTLTDKMQECEPSTSSMNNVIV